MTLVVKSYKCVIRLNLEMWVKGYGFLSFGKNMSKNLNNKFSQKIIDSAKHVQQMQ